MLRSMTSLYGYMIRAKDGDLGKVLDLYIDGKTWQLRYLAVDTKRWLPGRSVLICPDSLGKPDWMKGVFPVDLTKEQIENSPPIAADVPVHQQNLVPLHTYYGWPVHMGGGVEPMPEPAIARPDLTEREEDTDPNLRSTQEIRNYSILARDGQIGHVEDMIIDDGSWSIRYIVIDTVNWVPGSRKVLVSSSWVRGMSWSDREVIIDLTKEQIKNSPEYDPSEPVNRGYEEVLFDYYGRPKYWVERSPRE